MTTHRSGIFHGKPKAHEGSYTLPAQQRDAEEALRVAREEDIKHGGDPLLSIPSDKETQYKCNRDACITK